MQRIGGNFKRACYLISRKFHSQSLTYRFHDLKGRRSSLQSHNWQLILYFLFHLECSTDTSIAKLCWYVRCIMHKIHNVSFQFHMYYFNISVVLVCHVVVLFCVGISMSIFLSLPIWLITDISPRLNCHVTPRIPPRSHVTYTNFFWHIRTHACQFLFPYNMTNVKYLFWTHALIFNHVLGIIYGDW